LIIWESKPDVSSIPIHAGKRVRYNILKFGFLYQATLSSLAILVTMGSEAPVPSALDFRRDMMATLKKMKWKKINRLGIEKAREHPPREPAPFVSF
jgi:hypothetical protein